MTKKIRMMIALGILILFMLGLSTMCMKGINTVNKTRPKTMEVHYGTN